MYSMTGFGRGVCTQDGREMTIELKSVNHRFLDLGFRLPRSLGFLEDPLRKALQGAFARGHIDVYLSYRNQREDARQAVVDQNLAQAYIAASRQIGEMGATGQLSVADLMRLPDVVRVEENQDDPQALQDLLLETLKLAIDGMRESRAEEGVRMGQDIETRLALIADLRLNVAEREPVVVQEYRDKLSARLETLLNGVEVDASRLAQEVALFADKASISEELARLDSHITAMREAMASDEPVGRRLDFIVQELNRETNTIGSKAADLQILALVVDVKAEIEKIREQVQNIE